MVQANVERYVVVDRRDRACEAWFRGSGHLEPNGEGFQSISTTKKYVGVRNMDYGMYSRGVDYRMVWTVRGIRNEAHVKVSDGRASAESANGIRGKCRSRILSPITPIRNIRSYSTRGGNININNNSRCVGIRSICLKLKTNDFHAHSTDQYSGYSLLRMVPKSSHAGHIRDIGLCFTNALDVERLGFLGCSLTV